MFDWITGLVEQSGYLGVMVLMLAENVFPPIPSEVILPLAGFAAARGDLNAVLVVAAGTVGSLLGAVLWYVIGRWVGDERLKRWAGRYGRWLTMSPDDIDWAHILFQTHSGKAVFVGRLVPGVRTFISVPAGIVRMGLGRFMLYSALGSALWSALLVTAGYLLGENYRAVGSYLNPMSDVVIGGLVLGYLYRVATFRPRESL